MATTPKKARQNLFISPKKSPGSTLTQIKGYVIHVGQMENSRNGNLYFDAQLQITASDFETIRIMSGEKAPTRESLNAIKYEDNNSNPSKVLILQNVFQANDTCFFNGDKGSKFTVVEEELTFQAQLFCSKISQIITKKTGVFNVIAILKWVNEVTPSNNSPQLREAVLADETGTIPFTVWKDSFFEIEEANCYHFTHLKVKTYYGIKLNTFSKSSYQLDRNHVTDQWPTASSIEIQVSTESKYEKDIAAAEICGIVIDSNMICTCKEVIPDNGEKYLRCNICSRSLNRNKCETVVNGILDLNNTISLIFGFNEIDALFGAGTCDLYKQKLRELEKKFLDLEKLNVTYNSRTTKVISMTKC